MRKAKTIHQNIPTKRQNNALEHSNETSRVLHKKREQARTPILSESGFHVFPDMSAPFKLRLVDFRIPNVEGANAVAEAIERAIIAAESFMVDRLMPLTISSYNRSR